MNTPITEQAVRVEAINHDPGPYQIHAIKFSQPITGMSTKCTLGGYDADNSFTRVLKVASCVSICKTSTAETESGTLDMLYGQNGLAIDNGKSLSH